MAPETFLTVDELAERYGVPVTTVYKWNQRRTGPRFLKIGPRHVRYRLADVIAWEKASEKSAKASA